MTSAKERDPVRRPHKAIIGGADILKMSFLLHRGSFSELYNMTEVSSSSLQAVSAELLVLGAELRSEFGEASTEG